MDHQQQRHTKKKSSLSTMFTTGGRLLSAGGARSLATPSKTFVSPRFPDSAEGSKVKEAVVYMKYVRFGDLNVDVSINGFAIKLENYVASVPSFVRHAKVLTWKRLIRKIEKHLVWSITKTTASNMMTSKKGPGTTPHDERSPDDDGLGKSRLLFGAKKR
jgi:hypothetical protein